MKVLCAAPCVYYVATCYVPSCVFIVSIKLRINIDSVNMCYVPSCVFTVTIKLRLDIDSVNMGYMPSCLYCFYQTKNKYRFRQHILSVLQTLKFGNCTKNSLCDNCSNAHSLIAYTCMSSQTQIPSCCQI